MTTEATQSRNVAILIFDDVEVLDFCGPFEVFSVANRDTVPTAFSVYTVAKSTTVIARGGLVVSRHSSLEQCPAPDILLIPGGVGTRRLLEDTVVLEWITHHAARSQLVTSVCTGALLLGRCGVLDELEATTHHCCIDELQAIAPLSTVRKDRRYVDTGRVITSAGISAGIDMSLHIVRRFLGEAHALKIAAYMEYRWSE